MDMEAMVGELFEKMLDADRYGAQVVIETALNLGLPESEVLSGILDKALVKMGEGWHRNEYSLAQTFVAAKIAEDTLLRCIPDRRLYGPQVSQGTIILGNIEDDFHSLGRRIVASFLRAKDWVVIDLGNDVTAEDFVDRAVANGASLIGVSAMMHSTAMNIKKLRNLLDDRGLSGSIKMAVGGAVFNWQPELVAEVGGDGTTNTAFDASRLFAELKASLNGGVK